MATAQSTANREAFIEAMREAGLTSPVTRAEVKALCLTTGIYACPPAWMSHDQTRRTGVVGVYSMPELITQSPRTEFDRAMQTPDPDQYGYEMDRPDGTSFKCDQQGKPAPVQNDMVLAMTGGTSEDLIPAKNKSYVPWGHFSDVEKIVKSSIFYPMFITGLSGNGKTTMVEQVCAKLKREMFCVNITKQTDEDDLLGGFRLINGETVWQDGPVITAMKRGGVLLLDEVDLASHNIMCLQPVLEGKGIFLKKIGKFVRPIEGFQIFATANTKGKGSDDGRFIGTNILNEAFLDRFSVTLEQEYAPKVTELRILKKAFADVGCDEDNDHEFAKKLVDWADTIRQCFYQDAVDEIITTRRLVNIAVAYSIFNDRTKAIHMAITRFDDDTKESFLNMYAKLDAEAAGDLKDYEMSQAESVNLYVPYDDRATPKSWGAIWNAEEKMWWMSMESYLEHKHEIEEMIAIRGWAVKPIEKF